MTAGSTSSRGTTMEDTSHTLPQPGLSPYSTNRLRTQSSSSSRHNAATPTTTTTTTRQADSSWQTEDINERRRTPSSSRIHQGNASSVTPGRPAAASLTSPPRYATRASLGSVAFSPGKSPGSNSRRIARQNDEERLSLLPVQSHLQSQDHSSAGSSFAPSQNDSSQQYEYYAGHHSSTTPMQSGMHLDMSPEMQDLEAHLNGIAPTTPNHSSSSSSSSSILKEPSSISSSSLSASGKRRALPTPLDLSPPKATRSMSQGEQSVMQASPYAPIPNTHLQPAGAADLSSTLTGPAVDTSYRNQGKPLSSFPSPTTGNNSSRHQEPFTGLGLGLPFSHSDTSTSLASLASSSSSEREVSHGYAGKLASPLTGNSLYSTSATYGQTPSSSSSASDTSSSFTALHSNNNNNARRGNNIIRRQRSESDVLLSSPEEGRSPIVDRKGLVGLGELSTPRWTAAIHERRWNHHDHHHQIPSASFSSNYSHNSSSTPRLPLHDEGEENMMLDKQKELRSEVESSEGGWEGSVLGNYMDEKENDAYATYRKSMPAIDSYRSFSDVAAMDTIGTKSTTVGGEGQMSTSSSAYSLDAMSIPESLSSSSASSSEAGAFYTPSLRPGVQQDPLASYQIPNHLLNATNTRYNDGKHEDTFKAPKDRNGNELLDSSTTSTVLLPTTSKTRNKDNNATSSRGNSRTSSSSTTSASVQSSTRKAAPTKERERDIPSYMRGTAASANKRNSVTSVDDISRKQDTLASPSYSNQDAHDRHSSMNNKIRHSSPPNQYQQQQLKSTATPSRLPSTGRYDSAISRQSGHSRQSSMTSNSGSRKNVPTPINTAARDALPSSNRHPSHHADTKQPTSAKVSKSPSAIAHHILQQTLQQGLQEAAAASSSSPSSAIDKIQAYEEFDISAYAASHLATAEALSKLDGISTTSSPRVSRAFSTSSFKSNHTTGTGGKDGNHHDSIIHDHVTPKKSSLSRQNSKTSNRTTSPHSRPSSSRKSWAHSNPTLPIGKGNMAPSPPGLPAFTAKDASDGSGSLGRRKSEDQTAFAPGQTVQPPVKSPLRESSMVPPVAPSSAPHVQASRKLSLPSSISSPALPAFLVGQTSMDAGSKCAATGNGNSNLSPIANFGHPLSPAVPSRRGSGNRPSSSSGGDVPPTPSLSSKRSSSASLAFGTSTSGSRDSTSATSISAYGSPAQGKMPKSRRGSTSSDVSSVHSSGVDGLNRSDRSNGADAIDAEQAFARLIPPVPPLPKDWELYRPATTGGDSSAPTSASASSFKERDGSRISAMQSLGVADYRPGQHGQISRSSSLEKPAGPRPLRDASTSSLSPATASSPSLASVSSLPSPATASSASSSGLAERQQNASKTPTKSKWSLSNAFGMNRSPTIPTSSSQTSSLSSFSTSSLEKSTSFSNLSAISKQAQSSGNQTSRTSNDSQSELSRRKLASVPDIKSLAASSAQSAPEIKLQGLPHSVSAHQIGGRARTDSQSSASTANASRRSDAQQSLPTSPGRSLSSLLSSGRKESSSRQTPSGIPFWNRRPSASGAPSGTPLSPGSRKSSVSGEGLNVPSTPAQGDEKTGRRSILGINFFGRSSARKSLTLNKDNLPPSPGLPQHYAASNRASTASKTVKHDEKVSELGVRGSQESKRNSVGARASSLISGRKRGKTLPTNSEHPMKPESVNLPPMQMNALPPSTTSRLPSQNGEDRASETGTPQKRPLPVPLRLHRPSRVGDTLNGKATLPTITGSPSVAVNGPVEASTDTSGTISKPATPTRIPRLTGNRSNVSSPQYLEAPSATGLDKQESTFDGTHRRCSLKPGAGISSSVPDHNASYLKAQRDEVEHSSSSSSQEVPSPSDEGESKPSEQPKRRVLGSSTSQVPVLSSSRTSGKYQPVTVTSTTEKRRSLLASEKEEFKPTRTPLKVSQPPTSSSISSKLQSVSSTLASAATPNATSARVRTRTSDAPSSQRKPSTLVDGLPASKSMSSSLVSKLSIPSRMSKSATTTSLRQSPAPSDAGGRSTSSSRYGTPVGEDEIRGDEEMMEFVQRQRTKQASRGMSEEEIERLFTFPEPIESTRALSPQSALQLYRHEMCEYEMEEILAYKEVYYVGRRDTKKMATKLDSTNNHGYDDERGDYQIIEGDHIQYRYEIIDTLGKGSFGQVLRCRDHSTGDMVAVKIIRNKKRFHHQALVEIKVLENLKRWDPEEKNCLLVIGEHFTFRGHLCITTELLGINLYELIKANSFRGFSTSLIRRFTVQILAALSLLRHHRVVHCDLKPENILLKHPAKSAVKVIDFGSSCFENEKVYTYIQSRFYRSPEVILGMNYHMAIDMWSLGCILAELYTGMPIFPGENEASQLACIMEVLGVPDKHIIDRSSRKKLFFDSTGAPRPTVDSKGRRRRPGAKTLQSVLKCDDELFVDFITKCLTWDPDRRLKPGPALRHPFCAKGRSIASAPIPPRFSTTSTRSLLRSSNISTPRRLEKKPTDSSSVYSTPSARHEPSVPSTAPVQRTRTVSAAVPSSIGPSHNPYRSYAK